MTRIILDASAILAVIHQEGGYEKLTPHLLARAVASTVNLAEVQSKLVSRGWMSDEAWEDATSPIQEAVPFDQQQARIAGDLVAQPRHRAQRPSLHIGKGVEEPSAGCPHPRHTLTLNDTTNVRSSSRKPNAADSAPSGTPRVSAARALSGRRLRLPFGATEGGLGVACERTRGASRLATQGITQERGQLDPGPM